MNAIAQTANVETVAIRRLAHKTENFSVDLIEGKSQAAIMNEIKDANFNLGTKSLAALIKGEKTEAGDFMIVGGMQIIDGSAPADTPAPAIAPEAPVVAAPTKAEERAALKAQQQVEKDARIKAAAEAKAALATTKPVEAAPVAPAVGAEAPVIADPAAPTAPVDATVTPPAAAPVVKAQIGRAHV